MLLIGLTGSIATGKSTVSALLSAPPYNLPIIDADLLARKVVEPGTPGYRAIVDYFGPTTPDLLLPDDPDDPDDKHKPKATTQAHGRPLNRPVLGRRVFGDTAERKRDRAVLNRIVHPAVRWEIYRALLRHYLRGHWAVVLDVPLLFESGLDALCGTVVVVGVSDAAVQVARLRARDAHLSAEDAEDRVKSQGDVRGKVARAEARGGLVVWNDGDRAALEAAVRGAMRTVAATSPRWWAWALLLVPPLGVAVAAWNLAVNYRGRRRWERVRRAKL
ncbi:dephospho-CoA kinase [Histoplasma capsulatum var. duboisii H88]|uniref:Dephospho-CoA kinase n=2 Tax=Ajellomyces capsulatus TaxID=5037 RepID=F0UNV2_AJEC8|nr:dephospho-CoA kinase [Histoplasma capsulatum H143]EGC46864.1 dephospho-CoA kinase [Histoplasma capsulatum var. duboisii H88]QSS53039.1 dephospho-CoA kinase [Histoplasma capsulatum var. duboisii H88]